MRLRLFAGNDNNALYVNGNNGNVNNNNVDDNENGFRPRFLKEQKGLMLGFTAGRNLSNLARLMHKLDPSSGRISLSCLLQKQCLGF